MDKKSTYYASVTRRLLLAFFCLSLPPLVAVGWMTSSSLLQTNLIRLQEQAVSTANAQSDILSLFLDDKVQLLTMLVRLLPEDYFETAENINTLFVAIGSRGDYVDLQAIAADGRQYAYAGPYRSKIAGKNYADAPWFQETLLSGIHISNVFTGYRDVPHFVVAVTNPIKSYVLRATINSSTFNALVRRAQLSPHSDAFILNRDNEFQTPSLLGQKKISGDTTALISGERSSAPLITESNILVARPLANGQWQFIVQANIADSLSAWLPIRDRIIAAIVAILLLAIAGAILVSLLLAHHIRRADREHAADSLQFAHMEKMATIGRLAAGIAHEINNPLQMISSQVGWMAELLPEEEQGQVKNLQEYQQSIEKIRHHVKRAGTITHRLLGFSKKMAAQQGQVQVNDLLVETISFLDKEAERGNISVHQSFDAELPAILTDGPQLQQVFLNLINNAIDAAGDGGEITIATSRDADEIVITVADNGTGIAKEHLKQLFDPFFTTKQPDKGTGLGLYISYDIVKKLGGSISAANGKEGGAIFTLRLPIMRLGEDTPQE
ncbi:MAG: hypothetical protein CSA20_02055 [Deltaproteobacteria bacterium]|nr:MAG: hypothetical protein CSB23_00085 [Deltaproteobacteria bacterium]PIE73658.1 MAG: hypothetical protein CSA20_02055 [Deltaproteobacteria bacterium]